MYTNRSRGILSIDTEFAVRLIETITMLSVRKLGSPGSTSASLPINIILRISCPFDFKRGAGLGIAVTCGRSVLAPGSKTVGSLLVGPAVGSAGVLVAVGASVALGARVAVGGSATVGESVEVGETSTA